MATLITVSEYKIYAGISTTAFDTRLTAIVASAAAMIRQVCGRSLTDGFETGSRTERLDGDGMDEIRPTEWPVTTLTSVKYVSADNSETAYDTSSYRIADDQRRIIRAYGHISRFAVPSALDLRVYADDDAGNWHMSPRWPEGKDNIEVAYTGGFSTIPADLKMAMYLLVDQLFAASGKGGVLESESIGEYSYKRANASESSNDPMAVVMPLLEAGGYV